MYRARACGKAILLGEHFVVHGSPAIAIPVKGIGKEIEVSFIDGGSGVKVNDTFRDVSLLTKLIEKLKSLMSIPQGLGIEVNVKSTLPPGCHLGSSASIAVCLVKAFAAAKETRLELDNLIRLSYELEKVAHGNPSGIDNTVIAVGEPVIFSRKNTFREIKAAPGIFKLVIGVSPDKSSTAEVVSSVGRFKSKNEGRFQDMAGESQRLVNEAVKSIEDGDPENLGSLMLKNHELLKEIGVSTQGLDKLVQESIHAGAYGAKLTGAGGGGSMIAVVELSKMEKVRKAVERAGAVMTFESGI